MDGKSCNCCKLFLPLSEYHARLASADGLSYTCKSCSHERHRRTYKANKERAKTNARRWALGNPERRRQIQKRSGRKCYPRRRVVEKARYDAAKAKSPELMRRKWREQHRKWRQRNPARFASISRRARETMMRKDPDGVRMKQRNMVATRRARLRANGVERVSLSAIVERDGMICHLCRLPVEKAELEFDHLIPISKGGPHTFDNLAVSHASCNRSKGAKLYPDIDLRIVGL